MGNAPSRHPSASSAPPSSSSHATPNSGHRSQHSQHDIAQKGPRRRESIQTLTSTTKPTAAPPSASLEAASGSIVRPPSRSRSQTIATPQLKPLEAIVTEKMGSEQSALKNRPSPRQPSPGNASVSPAARKTEATPSESIENEKLESEPGDATSPVTDPYYLPTSHFARAPRLPLPIEEETHTPGSPIISPTDPIEIEAEALPRRANSVLSSTTVDDDDELASDLQSIDGSTRPAVPTVIEWRGAGEKVYVTGTFAGWERKFRLFKDGPSKHKDALSATINLRPGTHHIKFIIDGDMRVSDQMPTAVDFTNILVNYVEVSPDDLPQTTTSTEATKSPSPPPKPEYRVPPGIFPPQILPPTPELQAILPTPPPPGPKPDATGTTKPTPVAPAPPKRYYAEIPQFLIDLDAPEESPVFARASAVANSAPAPPSLPMFLGKSILNGSTPMKDDASVLIMPNHTVLNHLATSSIRNHVLATSATTRYKRKFLTTVMYKPTSEVGE